MGISRIKDAAETPVHLGGSIADPPHSSERDLDLLSDKPAYGCANMSDTPMRPVRG